VLSLVTVLAGGRSGLFHGMTRSAHPVCDILAKVGYMPRTELFSVTLLTIAFQVALMRPVWKCDAIFELEDRRAIFCKC
jgi:hypothetical protein